MGVPLKKIPLDLWVYQEILYETKPDVIIETGTCYGGSAFYMSSILDLLGYGGFVITIDVRDKRFPAVKGNPKVMFVKGNSVAKETYRQVISLIPIGAKVMVVLDSCHSQAHVSREIKMYSPLVTKGQYLIVEDTIVRHPVLMSWKDGPMEAVQVFLRKSKAWSVDKRRNKHILSFNPYGYIRRK